MQVFFQKKVVFLRKIPPTRPKMGGVGGIIAILI
jgi:hypothetical protein